MRWPTEEIERENKRLFLAMVEDDEGLSVAEYCVKHGYSPVLTEWYSLREEELAEAKAAGYIV